MQWQQEFKPIVYICVNPFMMQELANTQGGVAGRRRRRTVERGGQA